MTLIEKLRATGAKRNRLLMRQAANHIERLERIIKSAPVFDASHNSGEGLPNGDAASIGADTGGVAFTPAERKTP